MVEPGAHLSLTFAPVAVMKPEAFLQEQVDLPASLLIDQTVILIRIEWLMVCCRQGYGRGLGGHRPTTHAMGQLEPCPVQSIVQCRRKHCL